MLNLKNMTDFLQVFLLSMTPVGELRLAIPVGIVFLKLNVFLVLIISIIGNMIPVILILLFFKKILSSNFKKMNFMKKVFDSWQIRTQEKHSKKIEEYGVLGLMFFVAIPLPMTGAWTGALLAVLMNLPFKKAVSAIFAGVITSGSIVVLAIILGINIEKFFDWQVLLAVLMSMCIIYLYFKLYPKNKK